jgi:hypothetical protein
VTADEGARRLHRPDPTAVFELLGGLQQTIDSYAGPAVITAAAWDWHARTLALTVADRDAADALAHTMRLTPAWAGFIKCWSGTWEGLAVTITSAPPRRTARQRIVDAITNPLTPHDQATLRAGYDTPAGTQ